MPTPRMPDEWHRRKGSFRGDRHGANNPPATPPAERVGDPPAYLSPEAVEVWQALATAGWWLGEVDRAALEIACYAQVALRQGPTAALLSAASKSLSDLGLTPRARGAVVGLPTKPQENAADKLREALYFDAPAGEFAPRDTAP